MDPSDGFAARSGGVGQRYWSLISLLTFRLPPPSGLFLSAEILPPIVTSPVGGRLL